MSELCFITGDYTCEDEYEDCADCPTYKQEIKLNIDKDLPWRTATLTELSLLNGSQDKS